MVVEKFSNKYRISSARAYWHDYDGGMYFITVCTEGFVHYFGKIENGEMKLNLLGKYVANCIENTPTHFPDVIIPVYVVMPNHIHLIVCIDGNNRGNLESRCSRDVACNVSTMSRISPKPGSLPTVIRSIKSAVTRYANQHCIPFQWQSRFHDRIIRNQNECNRIADYIDHNPENWMKDELNVH